jgi:hypothetical protein
MLSSTPVPQLADLIQLVRLVDEDLARSLRRDHLAGDRQSLSREFAHLFLDARQVILGERLLAIEIVVEAVLDAGSEGELHVGVEFLHRPRHEVRRRMPQRLVAVVAATRDHLQAAARGGRFGQRVMGAVDRDREGIAQESLADAADRFLVRLARRDVDGGAVGQAERELGHGASFLTCRRVLGRKTPTR